MIPFFLRQGGPKRIAVALSGGVDSSVVAYLMQQHLLRYNRNSEDGSSHDAQQHELIAVHMSNWTTSDEEDPFCTHEQDWKDAQAVASCLHLPIHPTSFAADYWTQVFEPFTEGVQAGSRPNPDVDCNRYIKFGALRDYVHTTLKADILATGHYARLWDRSSAGSTTGGDDENGSDCDIPYQYNSLVEQMLQEDTNAPHWIRSWGDSKGATLSPLLLAARDRSKCQSFFLSSVPGNAFRNVVFPLGDLLKKKNSPTSDSNSELTVRDIAIAAELPTASKKDSMGICFVGKRPGGFTEFIDQYFSTTETQPYQFVDIDTGAIVENEFGPSTSCHMVYTGGQRAKISGASKPWFVVQTNRDDHTILVCQGTHHPALYTDTFYVRDLSWMAGDLPNPLQQPSTIFHQQGLSSTNTAATTTVTSPPVLHAQCRVRNLQPLVPCQVVYDAAANVYEIKTQKPLRAITPGQHCAIYVGTEGLVCLGGGTIVERGPTYHELNQELDVSNLHPAGHNDLSVLVPKSKVSSHT